VVHNTAQNSSDNLPSYRPEVVEGDMKSLKLNKEDVLVHSKWGRLIRGTEEDSDDSGG